MVGVKGRESEREVNVKSAKVWKEENRSEKGKEDYLK